MLKFFAYLNLWIFIRVSVFFQGSARRKKKVVHRTATTDDKKLQSSLKKLSVSNIPGIEEVCMQLYKFFFKPLLLAHLNPRLSR